VCKKLGKVELAMGHFTTALDLHPKDNNMIKVLLIDCIGPTLIT
jgi:hypothetical protein